MNRDLEHTGQGTVREPGAWGFPMAFNLLVSTFSLPRAPIAEELGAGLNPCHTFFLTCRTAWPASMQSLTKQNSGEADLLEHVKVTPPSLSSTHVWWR